MGSGVLLAAVGEYRHGRRGTCGHLAKLPLAGLVKGRREGTFVYYSAADDHVQRLLNQARFHADHIERNLPDQTSRAPPSRSLRRSLAEQAGRADGCV
jgi:hypothetical protein